MADVVKMTPQEEEMMIDNAYQNLLNGYLSSNHRKKVEIIEKAYKFAREAHKGVLRRSGEPYIMHPITVAQIVSQEIGLGSTSICAAIPTRRKRFYRQTSSSGATRPSGPSLTPRSTKSSPRSARSLESRRK